LRRLIFSRNINSMNIQVQAIQALANLNKLAFTPMPPDMAQQGGPAGAAGAGGPPQGGMPPMDPNTGLPQGVGVAQDGQTLIDTQTGQPLPPEAQQQIMQMMQQGGAGGPPPGAGGPPQGGPDPMLQAVQEACAQAVTQVLGQFFGQRQLKDDQSGAALQEISQRLDEMEQAVMSLMQASQGVSPDGGQVSPETEDVLSALGGAPKQAKEHLTKAANTIILWTKNVRQRIQAGRQELPK
jgi:hypothetical protein